MQYYKEQNQKIDDNVRKSQSDISDAIQAIDDIKEKIGEAIHSNAWNNAIDSIRQSENELHTLVDSATKSRNSAMDDIKVALTKVYEWHKKIAENPFVRHNINSLKKSINALYKKKKKLRRDYEKSVQLYNLWKQMPGVDQEGLDVQKEIVTTSFNIYVETQRQFHHLTAAYHQLKSLLKAMKDSESLKASLLADKQHYDNIKQTNLVDFDKINRCVSGAIKNIQHLEQEYDKTLASIVGDLETSRKLLTDFKEAINAEAEQAHKAVNAAQQGAVIAYDNWNYTMRCLRNSFISIGLQFAKDILEVGQAIVNGLAKVAEWVINFVATELFNITELKLIGQISTTEDTYLELGLKMVVIGIHLDLDLKIDLGNLGGACTTITEHAMSNI